MIKSANEFQIVKNVIDNTKGLRHVENWHKVQVILLGGTSHSGRTSSIEKAIELGVEPYSSMWRKAV